MSKTLQLTLAIFKPDVATRPHMVKEIRNMILNSGFYFVRSKHLSLSRSRAEEFYKEHEGRFFHNRLVSFMCSGPISTHILARENAIAEWRKLMGPTKVFKTIHEEPDSVRGRFGLTDTRNATHGSDSIQTALREIMFFFPEFNVVKWHAEEEILFREGRVSLNEDTGIHSIIKDSSFSVGTV